MTTDDAKPAHHIGTLNEKPLHAALKEFYAEPGDRLEVSVETFHIDIVRGDLLIEIQTRNVSAIKRKLAALLADHPVRLVVPIAAEKWIVKRAPAGQEAPARRKSPKRGTVEDVFKELVYIPHLVARPGFSLDVLLIREEEVRRHDPKRAWRRRGWVTEERRLLDVVERRLFSGLADWAAMVPSDVTDPFTTTDLAAALGRPMQIAQRMAYALRAMGALEAVGKQGNSILYERTPPSA